MADKAKKRKMVYLDPNNDKIRYLIYLLNHFLEHSLCLIVTYCFKKLTDEEGALAKIKDNPGNENPLLEKLCEIILEEYRVRPHSRAILFVKTIDTTQALQDWIMETPELAFLNPGRIAGSRG